MYSLIKSVFLRIPIGSRFSDNVEFPRDTRLGTFDTRRDALRRAEELAKTEMMEIKAQDVSMRKELQGEIVISTPHEIIRYKAVRTELLQ